MSSNIYCKNSGFSPQCRADLLLSDGLDCCSIKLFGLLPHLRKGSSSKSKKANEQCLHTVPHPQEIHKVCSSCCASQCKGCVFEQFSHVFQLAFLIIVFPQVDDAVAVVRRVDAAVEVAAELVRDACLRTIVFPKEVNAIVPAQRDIVGDGLHP